MSCWGRVAVSDGRVYREPVPGGRSTRRMGFTVSPEEAAVIEGRAARLGVRVPQLLADLALGEGAEGTASERRLAVGRLWALERALCELVLVARRSPGHADLVGVVEPIVAEIGEVVAGLAAEGIRS
jgi:hypothetical protein